MKNILQVNYAILNDNIPLYKIVDSKKESEENKKLLSFNAIILEGQFKDTIINFLKVSYKKSHVDFRTFYENIYYNGIKTTEDQYEAQLNVLSSNIALRELSKTS